MAFEYGYGLGDRLIDLFREGAPDFQKAEELIAQGADVNAVGKDDDENILSEVLIGYRETQCDRCVNDQYPNCRHCEHNKNPHMGEAMCQVIEFFLDHGFDVAKQDGCYGAQCLYSLTLSTFDRYMLKATKMLFDAGARDRIVSLNSTDEDDTPWDFIATEGSFQGTCEHDYASANIYEAVYQMYRAIADGRPYSGIDTYEAAVGKKVLKVLAEAPQEGEVFYELRLPTFRKENCFKQTLYFVYDGGYLVTTQYADFWVDTALPDKDFVDVSDAFADIIGRTITGFAFDHKGIEKDGMRYGQPIVFLEVDSGTKVRFSINFGEVEEKERAAFFEIQKKCNGNSGRMSIWDRIKKKHP